MSDPQLVLGERVQRALAAAFGAEYAGADPVIRPSQFADFQANVALALAKRLRQAPREVAGCDRGRSSRSPESARRVEVSGPGIRQPDAARRLDRRPGGRAARRPAARASPVQRPRQVVPIDYSAPNVAKEMHVGHLRTTVVGDALARILEFLGHHVIRQNHIGDWGTPFGMLIEHLLDVGEDSPEAGLLASDPNAFYQARAGEVRQRRRSSPTGPAAGWSLLQGGDPDTLRLWHELVELSTVYFNRVYAKLGVTLTDDGPRRREHLQRPARRGLRRAARQAGHRRRQRRRAVRVPRRLHRPRGPARSR